MLKGTEGKRFQLFLMGTKNKTLYQTLEGNIQQQYGKRKITPIICIHFLISAEHNYTFYNCLKQN